MFPIFYTTNDKIFVLRKCLKIKNKGKVFEDDWKSSVPEYCLNIRLPDPPQSFTQRSDTRFSHKNPCDFVMFSSKHRLFLPTELKSTKHKSISVQLTKEDNPNSMIKYHQIKALTDMSKYDYVESGFVLNFRNEEENSQITYWQSIGNFNKMMKEVNKKSFNEIDLLVYGAINVTGQKKITHYTWNVNELLDEINKSYE